MNTYLYMFVDYDGVVKTYAEGFPTYHNREQAPFSHSMIRVLSYIFHPARENTAGKNWNKCSERFTRLITSSCIRKLK